MKKLILILVSCFLFTGCSLIPKLTFNKTNTIPQSVDRSKIKDVCRGKAEFNQNGDIISCSKGYMTYAENYQKQERKYTFTEKIKNFINNLIGFGFWGLIILVILVPGVAGVFVGKIIEGTIGITGKALKAVVSGVQQARVSGKNLNDALSSEQDNNVKKYIRKLKEKENIK